MTISVTQALILELEPWQAINDDVMGGISRGEMVVTETGLRFQGALSLENNGGFASVRRLIEHQLDAADGVRLTFCGDGRQYQCRLRVDEQGAGLAWRASFETDGSIQSIDLYFKDFEAVIRGKKVPTSEPLLPGSIGQLGFLIADGQSGAFRLDITAIEFFSVSR